MGRRLDGSIHAVNTAARVRRSSRWGWLWLLPAAFAAAWYWAWLVSLLAPTWTSAEPSGLYHYFTDGLLRGTVALSVEPAPELLALPDPYDPAANAAYRLNDASLHGDRYYIYHGATPALLLYLPVRWLTGLYLSNAAASLLFCWLGLAGTVWIWGRALPNANLRFGPVAGAILALVLISNWTHVVLQSSAINGVAIAAGSALALLAIGAALEAVARASRPAPWLALASAAFGLAIASRPNYAFAAPILLLPLAALGRLQFSEWRLNRAIWTAAVLPGAVIVGVLIAYNVARFGSPFEFGQSYMLGSWDQRTLAAVDPGFIGRNLSHYLWGPGACSRFFPFVQPIDWYALGVVRHLPWLGIAALTGLFALKARRGWRELLGTTLLAALFAINFLVLVLLPSSDPDAALSSANARYLFDFLPMLTSAAGLWLIQGMAVLPAGRSLRLAVAGAILATGIASFLVSLSLSLAAAPKSAYLGLARLLNRPTALVDSWRGRNYGPLLIELRWPNPLPVGQRETLLQVGDDTTGDTFYVDYLNRNQLRFGVTSAAFGGPQGEAITVETDGAAQQMEVSLGSLLPPIDHPDVGAWSPAEIAASQRHATVRLGGAVVLKDISRFNPGRPEAVKLGGPSPVAPAFSGTLLRHERLASRPPDLPEPPSSEYGYIRCRVVFPVRPRQQREPLVVTGVPQAGDFVFVVYEKDTVRIGVDHWGYPGLISEPVRVEPGQIYELVIKTGALLPPTSGKFFSAWSPPEIARVKENVEIMLDGRVLIQARQPTYESSPFDVTLARNTLGGSSCGYAFSGELSEVTRLPLPSLP